MDNDRSIVYVLDDDAAVRDSLYALFTSVGLETRTYSSPEALLQNVTPAARGCLVLDMRLPSMSGLILQELLASRGIQLPILVITDYADVPSAVRAMRQGAVDFIEKPYNEQVLLDRVHDCIEMDIRRKRNISRKTDLNRHLASLTGRESEVLDAVIRGESSKDIAKALRISPKTVDVHRSRILEKLHARSTADLVRIVFETQDQTKNTHWISMCLIRLAWYPGSTILFLAFHPISQRNRALKLIGSSQNNEAQIKDSLDLYRLILIPYLGHVGL